MNNSPMDIIDDHVVAYELGLSDALLTESRDKEGDLIESRRCYIYSNLIGTDEDAYAYYNRGFNFGKFISRKLNKLDKKGDLS